MSGHSSSVDTNTRAAVSQLSPKTASGTDEASSASTHAMMSEDMQ